MAIVRGCEIPEDLWYDVGLNVWVRLLPDGTVELGMTDPAQTRAGRILRVTPKKAGRQLARGDTAAILESAKWVGPFPTPLTGVLLEANPAVISEPILINKDLYGRGWIVRLRPADSGREMGFLVTGPAAVEAYRRWLEAEDLYCVRCAEPVEPAPDEGGHP